jgi:DNA-binding MarR family transcriptional regulator
MKNSDLFVSPRKMKSFIDTRLNIILKDKEFKSSQVPYIFEIGNNDGCSLKELSILIGSDKGLTTRVVRNLIENDYVTNITESSRTYRLYLTEKGIEAYDISKVAMDQIFEFLFECLNAEDRENLVVITSKLNKRLDGSYKY